MGLHVLVQDVCLFLGAGIAVLCSLGVMVMPNPYSRLHYVSVAGVVCPPLFALAIIVSAGVSAASIKAVLVAATLVATSPVLTHATARAALVRERGRLEAPGIDKDEIRT